VGSQRQAQNLWTDRHLRIGSIELPKKWAKVEHDRHEVNPRNTSVQCRTKKLLLFFGCQLFYLLLRLAPASEIKALLLPDPFITIKSGGQLEERLGSGEAETGFIITAEQEYSLGSPGDSESGAIESFLGFESVFIFIFLLSRVTHERTQSRRPRTF